MAGKGNSKGTSQFLIPLEDDFLDDLPLLDDEHMAFVQNILSGNNVVDSYIDAFKPDPSITRIKIAQYASKRKGSKRIIKWLRVCKLIGLHAVCGSREDYLRECERLKELAAASGNYGAAVKAQELVGRATGYFEKERAEPADDDIASLVRRAERLLAQKERPLRAIVQGDGTEVMVPVNGDAREGG